MGLSENRKLLVAAALTSLFVPFLLTCDKGGRPDSLSCCYVYYQDGSPFGYISVSDLGRRADARGPFRLLRYRGSFRISNGAGTDVAFEIITAARDNGGLDYISYEEGPTEGYLRAGREATVYTLIRGGRVRSVNFTGKPAFFRVRGFFLPLPANLNAGHYPRPIVALDLETGTYETVLCRSTGKCLLLEFRGYRAKLVTTEYEYPEVFACTDGTVMKKEAAPPSGYLYAYKERVPAVALPFAAFGPGEFTIPLSVVISKPVDPAVFGPGFKGECLGGRASGEFTVPLPPGDGSEYGDPRPILRNGSLPLSADPTAAGLYCAGLAVIGGNLLRPVYWREPVRADEIPSGVMVLARAAEPTRIVNLEVTGPPKTPLIAGYSLDNPSYWTHKKEPLEYTVYYRDDEVGRLSLSYYEKQADGNFLLRTVGAVLGKKVERFRGTSLLSESGTTMRPFSLSPYNVEEFLALGAALSGARPGAFPLGFYVPVYGQEEFAPVKLSSVNFITVGSTGTACRVYDCGGTKASFDETGIPIAVERGSVRVVLDELPKREARKPEGVSAPSTGTSPGEPESTDGGEAVSE